MTLRYCVSVEILRDSGPYCTLQMDSVTDQALNTDGAPLSVALDLAPDPSKDLVLALHGKGSEPVRTETGLPGQSAAIQEA